MRKLRCKGRGEDVEVCRGLEEVVLVVGSRCSKGVEGMRPKGAGGGAGGVDRFKRRQRRREEVGCV